MDNPCEVSSTVSLKTSRYSSWWFYLLQYPSTSFFWEQRFWFTKQELWQAVCTTPPLALNVAALVAQTPEGTFQSRQCQPTVLPSICHLLFLLPEKLFLCLEFALLDTKHLLGFKQPYNNHYSLILVHGDLSNLLPATFCSPGLTDAWPREVGWVEGDRRGGGLQKCDHATWLWEKWERLSSSNVGFFTFCAIKFHFTHLRKKKKMCCFSFDRWTWLLAFWFLTNLYPKME